MDPEPELLGQKRIAVGIVRLQSTGARRSTKEHEGAARAAELRGAVGIVPMPSDWAAPIDSIPSGTAHLAERYPPLPGDAAPPASFYDDAERWRSVAAEYRERGFVVVRLSESACTGACP